MLGPMLTREEAIPPASNEPILDPAMPIVDAHHHLWVLPDATLAALETQGGLFANAILPVFRRYSRYLLDEYLEDIGSGHNVQATVFVDAHTMYRANGPAHMRSVGEVEFVNGVAAMADSGIFGDTRVCAGIVGGVDLRLGHAVDDVLAAHIQAGGGRYRGVRSPIVHEGNSTIFGSPFGAAHILLDAGFRKGFSRLQAFGLSFDAFLLEPQLADLIDLADTFPDTSIILNHVGTPVRIGPYSKHRTSRFNIWRDRIRDLAKRPNVTVKLGGLGTPFGGFRSFMATPPATSVQLAEEWRPYFEVCIEVFGADRCMFESNFPVDAAAGSYAVLWNTFKRITKSLSLDERLAIFSGTASRVYRLDL